MQPFYLRFCLGEAGSVYYREASASPYKDARLIPCDQVGSTRKHELGVAIEGPSVEYAYASAVGYVKKVLVRHACLEITPEEQ